MSESGGKGGGGMKRTRQRKDLRICFLELKDLYLFKEKQGEGP